MKQIEIRSAGSTEFEVSKVPGAMELDRCHGH